MAEVSKVQFPNTSYDIVAIGSSAGGLKALMEVLSDLPSGFPAALVIVQHLYPHHRSLLAPILGRNTDLNVKQACDGDSLEPGLAFVAPPDRHLLVNRKGTVSLSDAELVHFLRPSADLLFESVAACFASRSIAVVLSGTGSDGTMGVVAIKRMGGIVIVSNEETSEFYGMPGSAISTGLVDYVLPLNEIASLLQELVKNGEKP